MSLIISESTPGLAKSSKRYADATQAVADALEAVEVQTKRLEAATVAHGKALEIQAEALAELQNHFGGGAKTAKVTRVRK